MTGSAPLPPPTAATLPRAPRAPVPAGDAALRESAQRLEASFLAEMLKLAGLGESSDSFGGGPGEDQFASFLRQAQAEEMVKAGGIGLSEALFDALKERQDGK